MNRRLAIIGDGKMGRALAELAGAHQFDVAALLSHEAVRRGGVTEHLLNGAQVAVEFTTAASAPANIRACVAAGVPVVSGTTGWDAERAGVEADVRLGNGALLWAPNFSVGVHIFMGLVAEAARRLKAAGFDAHLVETHHAAKKDAPSGTARRIQDVAKGALGELPVTSVRTGHVPGTHELVFDAPYEQIRLEHVARDRRVFAAGALAAAGWLIGRRGVFSLEDMLA